MFLWKQQIVKVFFQQPESCFAGIYSCSVPQFSIGFHCLVIPVLFFAHFSGNFCFWFPLEQTLLIPSLTTGITDWESINFKRKSSYSKSWGKYSVGECGYGITWTGALFPLHRWQNLSKSMNGHLPNLSTKQKKPKVGWSSCHLHSCAELTNLAPPGRHLLRPGAPLNILS